MITVLLGALTLSACAMTWHEADDEEPVERVSHSFQMPDRDAGVPNPD